MESALLSIEKLRALVDKKEILSGVELEIKRGEILAVMGANGSGKSTLAQVLMGDERFQVKEGSRAIFEGQNLLLMQIEERARAGIYLAWQQPVTIPGVSVFNLVKASYEAQGHKIGKLTEFKAKLSKLMEEVGLKEEYLSRSVGEGFSGGERKRLELVQLLLLKPKLAILDEIDSGLDIDSLKNVGKIVKTMANEGTAFILITHYKRLLEYAKPDKVMVMVKGKFVKSGGGELIEEIEEQGYGKLSARV